VIDILRHSKVAVVIYNELKETTMEMSKSITFLEVRNTEEN
jgi:hypothetical protein